MIDLGEMMKMPWTRPAKVTPDPLPPLQKSAELVDAERVKRELEQRLETVQQFTRVLRRND